MFVYNTDKPEEYISTVFMHIKYVVFRQSVKPNVLELCPTDILLIFESDICTVASCMSRTLSCDTKKQVNRFLTLHLSFKDQASMYI